MDYLISQIPCPQNLLIDHPFIYEGRKFVDIIWNDVPNVQGYNVYRSAKHDISGNYEKINDEPVTVNFYRDVAYSREKNIYFYKVTYLFNNQESRIEDCPPAFTPFDADGWKTRMKYILKEIVRRHHLIINADGEVCSLFLRKRAGVRCPNCFNVREGVSKTSNCPQCYGTTFKGGFYKTPEMKVRVYSEQEQFQPDKFGITLKYTPMIRIAGSTPPIHKGDLILRGNNQFLHVEQVYHKHTQGIVTLQRASCSEIPLGDPHYKLLGEVNPIGEYVPIGD